MGNYAEQTVGELVAAKPARARFFEKIGIDYCCGGKKLLGVACGEAKRDVVVVEAALEEFDRVIPSTPQTDWTIAPIEELIDNIIETHHAYLKDELPRLSSLISKVDSRHREAHPELNKLLKLYEVFKITLSGHLLSEEQVLFPTIKNLAKGAQPGTNGEAKSSLGILIKEHDVAGADLREMRVITNGYIPPSDACNSYRAMLEGLEAMEKDIHEHIHKENNILFPRASQLIR